MRLSAIAFVVAGCLLAGVTAARGTSNCQDHFNSTFEAVQTVVFERHGCTSTACHSGALPAGGLDLSAGVAYDHLIDQPTQSVSSERFPGLARVVPGNKARSLLWLNLAGATLPQLWNAPLRPMPQGGLPPLSIDELDLVRLWIENGATREGVAPGTGELVDACLPPLEPLKVEPLPPPPVGLGVQLRAPHQVLQPHSEREVCFVSYYDLTAQVPAEFRGPEGSTFRYKRVDGRQDPLSHHGNVFVYKGSTSIDSPVWGPFACRGGASDGQPCEPTQPAVCGTDSECASPPVQALACIGFGPGDAGLGTAEETLYNTMARIPGSNEGIYEEAPLKGILVWNSHAFNITDTPADLDMWVNFEFAAPAEQQRPLRVFVDSSAITKMHVPAYSTEEICHHYVMPQGARALALTSHTHWRGKRFRVFEGAFTCEGGPSDGQACSPYDPDPGLPSPDLCSGFPCGSKLPPDAGDCNGDISVSIDEIILGVNIALEQKPVSACPRFDRNRSGGVTVDELVTAVNADLEPAVRDPDVSLLYISLTYADPLLLTFDPLRQFGGPAAVPAERTLTYCALYDNGFTNPQDVKRNSRVPPNSRPCAPTSCAEGAVGQRCARDADCDSVPGAGDGFCDACTLNFGITTDDEMFVLAGSFVEQ